MTGSPQPVPLSRLQQVVLVIVSMALAIGLLLMRGDIQSETPTEQLARRSIDLEVALTNGTPTIIEFYADWCQVCREMAPAMLELESSTRNYLDIILVNVDNPRWQGLVNRYEVNGIPQLNLFSADGQLCGRSIGLRQPEELLALSTALINERSLPKLQGVKSSVGLEQ
ncbi:thioredoxin domain-containing protein [Synechococcus sp. M16CYN]|uniref:thioredoxin domain-containing protein n=1 Tax=Synechococcus sp. M16CYN TaxID=3103139 RepID=UPI00324820A9